VEPRVGIVGLDDVAEQQRGAAIRVRELERVVDPNLPLAREHEQQRDQRQYEAHGDGLVHGDERDQ
jgi:hypothetical protein